jgi:uncharacterized protein (TIGR03083 family)
MTRFSFDGAQAADALVDAANRFADLVPAITDGSAPSKHVPEWTAAEIVRHVAFLPGYYTAIHEGTGPLVGHATEMASINDENKATLEDQSLAECESLIREGTQQLADRVRSASLTDPPVPFHAGSELNLLQLAGVGIGEFEVHGVDLSSALGVPWRIAPRNAAISLLSSASSPMAKWVDADAATGHDGRYEIRFRGGLGAFRLQFDDGELTTDPPDPWRPEAVVSADPAAFMRVMYGRQSQWSAIARGQIISWGTKPWKALGLKSKFLPV